MPEAQSSDLMYRLLVQGVRDYAIYLLDPVGVILNWNEGAARAKGYLAEEVVGRNFEIFYSDADRRAGVPHKNLKIALADGHLTTEGWRYRKNGTAFWASVMLDPVRDEHGALVGFAKITRDLTEQRDAEHRLLHLANHDPLTGLPNRAAFAAELEEALPQLWYGATGALHYIDLDRFKPVNDFYGHAIGDLLLQQVAGRLRKLVGPGDFVARLGGDEFAVLQMGSVGEDSVNRMADSIIDSLSEPFGIGDVSAVIGASVGIARAPVDGTTTADLLRNADLALYDAKERGRGCHSRYDSILNERAVSRRILELKLRQAILSKEFQLHYQPVASAQSGEIVAYEALLRWADPASGKMISPGEFIPMAEDLDLMVEIGAWVLREACRQAKSWPNEATVAVNVSATQLRDTNFVGTVREALASSGLPADRLELEITETAVLDSIELASKTLKQLRSIGVLIALDDFGTGFSSLSLVQNLPLTRIKIDQSFVRAIDDTRRSVAVIRAVVSLCKGFDLATTAEGVETEEQRRVLVEHGCQDLQGYLIGRPQPMTPTSSGRTEPSVEVLRYA
ncbi:putative bifunctional diguanylate cyclase/phosphodiesterase [Mangrovicella endophytica]|uniref:putative bifunctional diguanylate cyclase/phosphodiesterase n=1 Tax=Mangrovicella endophytica TaxID=2066697 RepID=UPI000C9E5ECD|nr:GGDEF and EAL domain-containing protein [Mangrovicella endophytica]